jgi:hypothetical protein
MSGELHCSIVREVGMRRFSIGAKPKFITHGFSCCRICWTKEFKDIYEVKVWQRFCEVRKLPQKTYGSGKHIQVEGIWGVTGTTNSSFTRTL